MKKIKRVPLAEVEEDVPEEKETAEKTSGSVAVPLPFRPGAVEETHTISNNSLMRSMSIIPRIQDSEREVSVTEPIASTEPETNKVNALIQLS